MTERGLARSPTARAGLIAVLIGGTALALWATLPHRPRQEEETAGPVSVSAALRGDPAANEGYARVRTPRSFRFPDDHGPHPEFRTEWWYFTGNLEDADGRPFGYQLTFFRIAQSRSRCPRFPVARQHPLYGALHRLGHRRGVPSTTTSA